MSHGAHVPCMSADHTRALCGVSQTCTQQYPTTVGGLFNPSMQYTTRDRIVPVVENIKQWRLADPAGAGYYAGTSTGPQVEQYEGHQHLNNRRCSGYTTAKEYILRYDSPFSLYDVSVMSISSPWGPTGMDSQMSEIEVYGVVEHPVLDSMTDETESSDIAEAERVLLKTPLACSEPAVDDLRRRVTAAVQDVRHQGLEAVWEPRAHHLALLRGADIVLCCRTA
eukprot:TRINITY_DN4599_c0_g1_i2.p1 TRINITY_DN4599_c0_g1~~TRINITY_DN4599_c0_g1_i2.p1  ORF type:complete len:224 (+),score=38.56 TRINITY_DN4599_c0_g1_i2:48-719(+)